MEYYSRDFLSTTNKDLSYRTVQETEELGSYYDNFRFVRIRVNHKDSELVFITFSRMQDVMFITDKEQFQLEELSTKTAKGFDDEDCSGHIRGKTYIIDKESLRRIAEANTLSIRCSGNGLPIHSWEHSEKIVLYGLLKYSPKVNPLTYFRAAYNALYDSTAYVECANKVKLNFFQRLRF